MTIEFLANSEWGPSLGRGLTRWLSRQAAYRLAEILADAVVARRGSRQVRAVRSNLAVVRGCEQSDPTLDAGVRSVFRNAARGYVDLFRAIDAGPEALVRACRWDPAVEECLKRVRKRGKGAILVAPHTAGFDIGLLTIAGHGVSVQGLAIANPRSGYRAQNHLRMQYGLEITPISMASLRAAIRRLRSGGIVLTGVDRPMGDGVPVTFFGRRTVLPVGHVRLAQETGAPLVFVASRIVGEGEYLAFGGDVLMPDLPPTKAGLMDLAQEIVARMETVISQRPEEWLMFFPVWP